MCYESIQISNAFSDSYHNIFKKGDHSFSIDFVDLRDVIDIHNNGLKFFSYCSGPFETLSSFYMTSMLWTGGEGTDVHLPVFGSMPTTYQTDGNVEFLGSFTGQYPEERIIQDVFIDYN